MPIFGLRGKVLVVREAADMAAVRRDQEVPPCQTVQNGPTSSQS